MKGMKPAAELACATDTGGGPSCISQRVQGPKYPESSFKGDIGPYKGHMRLCWNMDVGWVGTRGSEYPIFKVSAPKFRTFTGFWSQKPKI